MTISPLERLHAEVAELAAEWAAALPAFGGEASAGGGVGAGGSGGGRGFEALSGPGLVRVIERAGQVKRIVDAFLAHASAEVARRSVPEFGAGGLAKQHGHASPVRLIEAATGGAAGEAARLVAVGEAIQERQSFTGTVPAKFPHVRAALDTGRLSVEAANLITGMLRRVELRADPDRVGSYEQRLVEIAAGQPLSLVRRAVTTAHAQLDTDSIGPADERLPAERSLTFREDPDGVFHLRGRLDPVTAAPIKAALDAMVSDALRQHGSGGAGAGAGGETGTESAGPVVEDRRSIPQIRADALAELARHALGCQAAPGSVPATTVVVRMSLEALREGVGVAEIDGVDRPIAAGTVGGVRLSV